MLDEVIQPLGQYRAGDAEIVRVLWLAVVGRYSLHTPLAASSVTPVSHVVT